MTSLADSDFLPSSYRFKETFPLSLPWRLVLYKVIHLVVVQCCMFTGVFFSEWPQVARVTSNLKLYLRVTLNDRVYYTIHDLTQMLYNSQSGDWGTRCKLYILIHHFFGCQPFIVLITYTVNSEVWISNLKVWSPHWLSFTPEVWLPHPQSLVWRSHKY